MAAVMVTAEPIKVKVVVVAMFEPGEDTGDRFNSGSSVRG